MNTDFEELADRLSKEVATQLGAVKQHLSKEVATQLGAVEQHLSKEVAKQLGAVEQRLTARVDHAEDELKRHSKAHMESLKVEVKLAAEGYGATLEGIDRSLKELSIKWDTKITDHDLVLSNHTKRLENLEQRG